MSIALLKQIVCVCVCVFVCVCVWGGAGGGGGGLFILKCRLEGTEVGFSYSAIVFVLQFCALP